MEKHTFIAILMTLIPAAICTAKVNAYNKSDGLDKLASEAEAIAAIEILSTDYSATASDGPMYAKAKVSKVLKGNISPWRKLHFGETGWWGPTYKKGQYRIVFLARKNPKDKYFKTKWRTIYARGVDFLFDQDSLKDISRESLLDFLKKTRQISEARPKIEFAVTRKNKTTRVLSVKIINKQDKEFWLNPSRIKISFEANNIRYCPTISWAGHKINTWEKMEPAASITGSIEIKDEKVKGQSEIKLMLSHSSICFPYPCWIGVEYGNVNITTPQLVQESSSVQKGATVAISVMTSRIESWSDRCEAEDKLRQFPAELVLKGLLEHFSKPMPSLAIWNSAGREHDKQAPVEWQIYYAVYRSWQYHLTGKASQTLGVILLELLGSAPTPTGQERILHDIARHWHPTAEFPLSKLMKNQETEFGVRRAAGFCLMLHKGKVYHDNLVGFAEKSVGNEKNQWFDLLVDSRHKHVTGIDSAVVRLGFELLAEEKAANPDYVHGAYFIACKLGNYIDHDFKPDQNLDKYQDRHGLKVSFFADTVENALAWWVDNRDKYDEKF
ncbi:MAG: hypothetical protein GY845_27355 [Planctomycetes bacterium]|nr:hypothetical protein [Planctomycetota bacterium]